MLRAFAYAVVALALSVALPAFAFAEEAVPGTGENGTGEKPVRVEGAVVVPVGLDPLGRDQAPMQTNADPGLMPGMDSGMHTGNPAAVIQGGPNAPLPEGVLPGAEMQPVDDGTNQGLGSPRVASGAATSLTLALSGFVDAGGSLFIFNDQSYALTFLPRRLELDVDAGYGDAVRIHMDLGVSTAPISQAITAVSPVLDRDLMDALAQQAYVEWSSHGLRVRGGKIERPYLSEPLDVTRRVSLSRSTLAERALPDTVTGVYADYELSARATIYALAANGWDTTVESGNRSKTFGLGLPHHFGRKRAQRWTYEGNVAALLGAERAGINDLKGVLNYSGKVGLTDEVALRGELVYGVEQHQGYRQDEDTDPVHDAKWYGGLLAVGYDHREGGPLAGLMGDLRVEYVHDPDLIVDLPRLHNLPNMTTLIGLAVTARYALSRGLDVGTQYRVNFERGDVRGVSFQRGGNDNIFEWYKTQEILLDLIGSF